MEEEKNTSESFLHIIQSTFLSVIIIIIISLFITYQTHHTLRLSSFFAGLAIIFLFFLSIGGFILSGIFYYLNKNIPMLLYLIFFFFSLWALIFILTNSVEKKYNNQIPDIMDGASEYLTIKLIKIIFIFIISNYIIVAKNWFITKKSVDFSDKTEL
jgi:hypothetical protein